MIQNRESKSKLIQWINNMSRTREAKLYNWEKDSPVSKSHWENWMATYKEWKQYLLTSYTKINSKWIKDLKPQNSYKGISADNSQFQNLLQINQDYA